MNNKSLEKRVNLVLELGDCEVGLDELDDMKTEVERLEDIIELQESQIDEMGFRLDAKDDEIARLEMEVEHWKNMYQLAKDED